MISNYYIIGLFFILLLFIISFIFAKKYISSIVLSILFALTFLVYEYKNILNWIYVYIKKSFDELNAIEFFFRFIVICIIYLCFDLLGEFSNDLKNNIKIVLDYEEEKVNKIKAYKLLLLFILYTIGLFITENILILFFPIIITIFYSFNNTKIMKTRENNSFDLSRIVSILSFLMINLFLLLRIVLKDGSDENFKLIYFIKNGVFLDLYKNKYYNILSYIKDLFTIYGSNDITKFISYFYIVVFIILFIIYILIKKDYIKTKKNNQIKINYIKEYKIYLILLLTLIFYIFRQFSLYNIIDINDIRFRGYILNLFSIYFYKENKINIKSKNVIGIEDRVLALSSYLFTVLFFSLIFIMFYMGGV